MVDKATILLTFLSQCYPTLTSIDNRDPVICKDEKVTYVVAEVGRAQSSERSLRPRRLNITPPYEFQGSSSERSPISGRGPGSAPGSA